MKNGGEVKILCYILAEVLPTHFKFWKKKNPFQFTILPGRKSPCMNDTPCFPPFGWITGLDATFSSLPSLLQQGEVSVPCSTLSYNICIEPVSCCPTLGWLVDLCFWFSPRLVVPWSCSLCLLHLSTQGSSFLCTLSSSAQLSTLLKV